MKKIAILASGDGSNFESIVAATRTGMLQSEVVGLISNRPTAKVLERAARLKITSQVLPVKNYASLEAWDVSMVGVLKKWQTDWVVLAGFTGLIGSEVLSAYPSRIVNSHPSLLPKFGGKGMYGSRVHEAVLNAGEVESGITVHLLNERFDEGPIVAQKRVPVQPGDTVESLAERIKLEERKFYPAVLQELLTGRIKSR